MDQTQRIDPNRTMLTGAPALNDPLRTQAMGAFDPLKTTAMAPMVGNGKGLMAEVIPGREATMANGPAREQFVVEFTGAGAPVRWKGRLWIM